VLIPRRQYAHFWHRFLHDRTADSIAQALSVMPHSNVTIVPYHLGTRVEHDPKSTARFGRRNGQHGNGASTSSPPVDALELPTEREPIAGVHYRQRARVAGRIRTVRVQPHGGIGSLECTLADDTGTIALVFLGRRSIAGMKVGARVVVEGTVGEDHGHLAMLNPTYEFLPDPTPHH
jgi:hypothetical protein